MTGGISFGQTLPYSHAAMLYLEAGWSPLPLFPGARMSKGVPPRGYTGRTGKMATAEDVGRWVESEAGRPIAIRLPDGVVGIDVDAYEPKHGGETWLELCRRFGELPATWISSARDDLLSGIRFYRIPGGLPVVPAQLGTDIDVIWHGYRFARVWPSSHPSGMMYKWIDVQGRMPDDAVPVVSELPELPASWLPLLSHGNPGEDENDHGWQASDAYLKPDIVRLRTEGMPLDCNHDSTLSQVVWDMCRLGATDAEIEQSWKEIVIHTELKNPQWPFGKGDFDRHLDGARRKLAETAIQPAQRAWAESQAVAAPPAANGIRTSEVARTGEVAGEASSFLRLVESLLVRGNDSSIHTLLTREHLPRSDMSSADFIKRYFDDRFRFSTNANQWRLWDGVVYIPASSGELEFMIQQFARAYKDAMRMIRARVMGELQLGDDAMTPQQAREQYERVWRKHRTYRDSIWMQPGQARILRQLVTQCALAEEEFDGTLSEQRIAADNAIITIAGDGSVILDPHRKENYITKRLSRDVKWDESSQAPCFMHFLETSVPDRNMRRWLQCHMGMALIGKPGKQFVNLIGKTNSGKSTFIRIMRKVLGSYASSVSVETFLTGVGNTDFRLHELKGIRFAFASEPAANRQFDTEVIKSVTGGDDLHTREPYGKFTDWKPRCLILIASNQPQRFESSDSAMLNRIVPVAFSQNHDIDPELDEKLEGELDGILVWLVNGTVMALRDRSSLEMPSSMLDLRERMVEYNDDAMRFVRWAIENEYLEERPHAELPSCISVGSLYAMFQAWAAEEGIEARFIPGRKTFSARVGRRWPTAKYQLYRFTGLVIRE